MRNPWIAIFASDGPHVGRLVRKDRDEYVLRPINYPLHINGRVSWALEDIEGRVPFQNYTHYQINEEKAKEIVSAQNREEETRYLERELKRLHLQKELDTFKGKIGRAGFKQPKKSGN